MKGFDVKLNCLKKHFPFDEVIKVTNKNSQDMWEVSNFLLEDGVRKSILVSSDKTHWREENFLTSGCPLWLSFS